METKTFKETDHRAKAYYRFAGKRITHSIFGSSKHPAEGIACITSTYTANKMADCEVGKNYSATNLLLDNGEFYHVGDINPTELRLATDEEIKAYTETLASRNLEIGECVVEHKYLNGVVEHEHVSTLRFIDPNAIPYRMGDKDLTRAELESLELPSGQSLLYYHDNGYSYLGVAPASKESFLRAVDTLIGEGRFATDNFGVQLTRRNPTEPYAVNVRVGKNERYSEVSFS